MLIHHEDIISRFAYVGAFLGAVVLATFGGQNVGLLGFRVDAVVLQRHVLFAYLESVVLEQIFCWLWSPRLSYLVYLCQIYIWPKEFRRICVTGILAGEAGPGVMEYTAIKMNRKIVTAMEARLPVLRKVRGFRSRGGMRTKW